MLRDFRIRLTHMFTQAISVTPPPPRCACRRRFATTTSSLFHDSSVRRLSKGVLSPTRLVQYSFLQTNTFQYATSSRKSTKDVAEMDSLTPEEAIQVLKVVNEVQQAEDLLKYIIPKKKAEEVVKRKNESDEKSISDLDQLISIIGPKSSSKFFCSVLNKPIPVSISAAMFPVPTSEEISCISSVLSIIIVGDRISWCLAKRLPNIKNDKDFNCRLNVESFHQVSYPFKPRMHFLTLLKEMETVSSQLPESELYLVEEYPSNIPTPYMFNFQLQMAQAKSMILGLLTSRATQQSKIISVKTVAVARLFNTYIGSEKVSGQYLVENMLIDKPLPSLEVSESTLQTYTTADVKVKEGLSQAILLNFSYWKMTQQIKIP